MNLQIQIEQLIVEEMNLTSGARSRLQTAVETELSRLIRVEGLPIALQGGGFISKLPITVNSTESISPEILGTSIARFVYAQLQQ
jgi:hypothetical protein